MDFKEYQRLAQRTEKTLPLPQALQHGMLGIITEAGELGDTIKKSVIYEKPLDFNNVEEEIGDLLWYIAVVANACGINLEDCAVKNIEKLWKRYPEKYTNEHAGYRLDKTFQKG